MAKRGVIYGYGIEEGKIKVVKNESDIINNVFNWYINGKTLLDISNILKTEKIPFDKDNFIWNKNKIYRIIKEKNYIGNCKFPAIVDNDIYLKANNILESKGRKKLPRSKIIDNIIDIVYCRECGQPLYRRAKSGKTVKWLCHNKCIDLKNIDDDFIIEKTINILKSVKNKTNNEELDLEEEKYKPTIESIRLKNEIQRAVNEKKPSFQRCKNLIFKYANLKFEICQGNIKDEYNDVILDEIEKILRNENLDGISFKRIIKKINIDNNGELSIEFINGKEIREEYNCR